MAESWFLCLSTFQCDHKGATESEAGPSRRDHRCPSLANTGVVASTSGNDCQNSHPPSKQNFPPLSSPSSGDKTHIATKDAFDAMQGIREKFITLGLLVWRVSPSYVILEGACTKSIQDICGKVEPVRQPASNSSFCPETTARYQFLNRSLQKWGKLQCHKHYS